MQQGHVAAADPPQPKVRKLTLCKKLWQISQFAPTSVPHRQVGSKQSVTSGSATPWAVVVGLFSFWQHGNLGNKATTSRLSCDITVLHICMKSRICITAVENVTITLCLAATPITLTKWSTDWLTSQPSNPLIDRLTNRDPWGIYLWGVFFYLLDG